MRTTQFGVRPPGTVVSRQSNRRHSSQRLALTAVAMLVQAMFAPQVSAQGIVTDGRTLTTLNTAGNVTTVTTATVSGASAFNSFSGFQVTSGKTANLVLAPGTSNLVNLVGAQVSIDGVVNAVTNGAIGGHVFFASTQGLVVGASGVLNVGSLSVSTPPASFISGFFNAGVPSAAMTAQLLSGTEPISSSGLISIQGRVNAVQDVALRAGQVTVGASGVIAAGASFSGTAPDFSDLVNTNGLVRGAAIVERNGRILISTGSTLNLAGVLGANTVELASTSASGGAVGVVLSGADVAGRTLSLNASSTLSDSSLATTLGTHQAQAFATIDIDGGRLASENGGIAIQANAQVATSTYSSVPTSLAVLRSSANASVDVHNGAMITSTVTSGPAAGNVTIAALSTTTATATPSSALANLNGDAMVAVTDVASTSSVHVGADAADTASTVGSIHAAGALSLSAVNTVTTTATANASAAGAVAAGASVAVSKLRSTTEVIVDRGVDVNTGGTLGLSATSLNNATVSAKSTAQGAQEDTGGAGRASQTLSQYGDQAKTSEGGVKVAGAVAVSDLVGTTAARLGVAGVSPVAGVLSAGGNASLIALASNVAAVDADASATGGTVGVAAAVGINLARVSNQATVGQDMGAQALSLAADMAPNGGGPSKNQFTTSAASGAGASNVGVAGALAVNAVDTESRAQVQPGVAIALGFTGQAALSLLANDVSVSSVAATPVTVAAGAKVGIGASIAVNVVANRSLAEVASGAVVSGAGSVALSASGSHTANTEATAGAEGGIAITPAVAVTVVNNSTKADFGAGAVITTQLVNGSSGDITLGAEQTASETTKASGSATGGKAAIGAAVAVAVVNDTVLATSARNIDGAGNVGLSASGASLGTVEATASAAGGKSNDDAGASDANGKKKEDASVDDKVANQMKLGADNQSSAGVGDAGQKSDSSSAAGDKPSASSSEGKVAVAAAVGVNVATSKVQVILPDTLSISAGKKLSLASVNNTDGTVTTKGDTVGSAAVGIGAAVSINLVKTSNQALLGDGAGASGITVTAGALDVSARKTDLSSTANPAPSRVDQYGASATAGAGSGKVGIAGALALNLVDTESRAQISKSAVVTIVPGAGTGAVSLSADNQSATTASALPVGSGASGATVGIGASIAVNVVANRSVAEISSGAALGGAGSVALSASGSHTVNTEATAGAEGGIAITPAVAVAVVNNSTKADFGAGAVITTQLVNGSSGDITLGAQQSATETTKASGSATGGKAAIGAAVAVAVVNDTVLAQTSRSLSGAGEVGLSARGASLGSLSATASAAGGKGTDEAGTTDANGKKQEDATVDAKVDNQVKLGRDNQNNSGVGDSTQKSDTSSATAKDRSASSKEGQVAVAAAIGVNVARSDVLAQVDDGLSIHAGGALAVTTTSATDGQITASGKVDGTLQKVGIGAAVAVNVVSADNSAILGTGAHDSSGFTVSALKTEFGQNNLAVTHTDTFSADTKAGAGGSKVGIAGSLSLNIVDDSSQAILKGHVNAGAGAAAIKADNRINTIAKSAPDGLASGGTVGIGASVSVSTLTAVSEARIADNAGQTSAGSLLIAANLQSDANTESSSGAKGGKVSIDASVSVALFDETTTASIGSGSQVATSGNIGLNATAGGTRTAKATGLTQGGNVGVGAAVAVNTSDTDTDAIILGSASSSAGSLSVAATSDRAYQATTSASASGGMSKDDMDKSKASGETSSTQQQSAASTSTLAANQSSRTSAQTPQSGGSSSSEVKDSSGSSTVKVAAAVGVNVLADKVGAKSGGGDLSSAGAMGFTATNRSNFNARGDGAAVDPNAKVGIAVGVGINVAQNDTTAAIGDGTHVLNAGALSVSAVSSENMGVGYRGKIASEGLAGAGSSKVGIAGAFAVAYSASDTQASIGANTQVDHASSVLVASDNSSNLSAKAWSGAASGNAAVGASIAVVVSDNSYDAFVGSGAHITSSGAVTVSSVNHPILDDPSFSFKSWSDFKDSVTTQPLFGNHNYYTEAIGGAASGGTGVAGAFAVNVFTDRTTAHLDGASVVNAAGTVTVSADNQATVASLAGAAAAGSNVGVGISSAVIKNDTTTRAFIADTAQVTRSAGIVLGANANLDASVFGISAAGGGDVGVAGVLSLLLSTNTVEAYAGNGTVLKAAGGGVAATAQNKVEVLDIAGGVAFGGSVGVGASAATNVFRNTTRASLGDDTSANTTGTTLDTEGAVTATANAENRSVTVVIAGGAAGSVGVGAGVAVDIVDNTTSAYIAGNSHVNTGSFPNGSNVSTAATLPNAFGVAQSVSVAATDRSHLITAAGVAGIGGSVGVGAGIVLGLIDKDTSAYIGSGATVNSAGNIAVAAGASESIGAAVATGSAGGSVGITGSAGVYKVSDITSADIKGGATHVKANGSVTVAADAATSLDMIAGGGAFGGAVGVGLSAAVAILDPTTTAGIGGGASVDALGNLAAVSYADSYDVAFGALTAANGGSSGSTMQAPERDNSSSAPFDVAPDTELVNLMSQGRTATRHQKQVQGLAVTATNTDSIRSVAVAGAAAGTVAVTLSGDVHVVSPTTSATIGVGALVNQAAGAGAGQSVVVGAANDFYHLGIAGSVAGAGVAGLGAGADVSVLSADTTAAIKSLAATPTKVSARRDVTVEASALEDLVTVAASAGVGGAVGVAGSAAVYSLSNTTQAMVGEGAIVNAGGNVAVTAEDRTRLALGAGSLGIGVGVAGVGGSVGVVSMQKDTEASIGDQAVVDAAGNGTSDMANLTGADFSSSGSARGVKVFADSSENSFILSAAGAGGFFAGVAGAVTVETIQSRTAARIGDDAFINTHNNGSEDAAQDVNVGARSSSKMRVFDGGIAVGIVGVAGAVDIGSVQNTTQASIGAGTTVKARRDVAVNMLARKDLGTVAVSAAVGAVGLAGGVSVYSVGTGLSQEARDRVATSSDTGDEGNPPSFSNPNEYADSQAGNGKLGELLGHSSDSRLKGVSNSAQASRSGIAVSNTLGATTIKQNSASIGSLSTIDAGHGVAVKAGNTVNFSTATGGAAGGLVGIGAGIGVASIAELTDASIGTGGTVTARGGDIQISAHTGNTINGNAYAGAAGAIAASAAVAILSDTSVTSASLGGTAVAKNFATQNVNVQALSSGSVQATSIGISLAGGVAIGASVAQAKSAPLVSAVLANGTVIDASNLLVDAQQQVPLNRPVAAASASGSAGGLLAGVTATDAQADYGTSATKASTIAKVGDNSVLTVTGSLQVSATNNSSQYAESLGLTVGIVAAGANDAYARSNTVTHADIGDNVNIKGGTAGSTSVIAQGTDVNIANSISGSGGIIAGSAASANTIGISDTRASIGMETCGLPSASCGIATGDLVLRGSHDTVYNAKVDSVQASVAGASGATNTHLVNSTLNVAVGSGVNVTAGDIEIAASNATHKFWWGLSSDIDTTAAVDNASWNVNSGSGGLLNLPAGTTTTNIFQLTNVSLGNDSLFHVMLPAQGTGAFTLDANNLVVSYDKVKLDSGGAIALAESRTVINATVAANVTLGANTTITSDSGDIDIGSRTDAKLDARAVANAYGLAGAPSGQAYVNFNGSDTTTLGSGALLLATDGAHGAINLAAGRDSGQAAGAITAHTGVNLWNKTAIPIPTTPDAQTNVSQAATLTLAGGSNILAAGDVGLAADRGDIKVDAIGVGKDLYREVLAALASAFGIDASLDIKGGSAPTPGGVAQVNVNGTVLSGLLRQSATQIDVELIDAGGGKTLLIDPNANDWSWRLAYSQVDSRANPGLAPNPLDASKANPFISWIKPPDVLETVVAPNSLLQARISTLSQLRAQYASDPVASAAYDAEIAFLTKKLGPQGIGQNNTSVTPRGEAALNAAGSANLAVLDNQTLITGDIMSATRAGQIGAVGALIDSYLTLDANNSAINTALVGLKNKDLTNTTYVALGTNRTNAADSYDAVRTNTALIGNYKFSCNGCAAPESPLGVMASTVALDGFRTVAKSGYLGIIQDDMRNVALLALKQDGGTGSLVSSITDLSAQMNNVKLANTHIVGAAANIRTNLSQAANKQDTLSNLWRDTANSNNVDTAAVATVTGKMLANVPLIGNFNDATGGTAANAVKTNADLFAVAVTAVGNSISTVSSASDVATPGSEKLITLPDISPEISVKLGNVNVQADVLAGTGALKAPGDAKIWIINNAPASMNIGSLTVDSTGGNVRLNGFLVNSDTDVRAFNPGYTGQIPTIVSRENGAAGVPEIRIVSSYDPGAYCCSAVGNNPILPLPAAGTPAARQVPAPAPDITLGFNDNLVHNTNIKDNPSKHISNPNGSVTVTSAAGDIYVDGSITARSVSILASNGDFVQQYVNGFDSVVGEPNSNVQGGPGVLGSKNGAAPGAGIVANGNIFISARYLNINGLVQSGIVNYHLDIPADADLRFVLPGSLWAGYTSQCPGNASCTLSLSGGRQVTYDNSWIGLDGTVGRVVGNKAFADNFGQVLDVAVTTNGVRDYGAIDATYDPATGKITMTSNASVRGGNIQLFGQIINTGSGVGAAGSGKLAVLDGFGQIAVNNQSSLALELKSIDTGVDPDPLHPGRGTVGTIHITDVQYVGAAGDQTLYAIDTLISRYQDKITYKQTGKWNADGTFCISCVTTDSGGTNYALTQNDASRVSASGLRLGGYNPQAGLRYVFTTGKNTSTQYTWTFSGKSFFGTNSLNLPPSNVSRNLTSGPNVLSDVDLKNGIYLSYKAPAGQASHVKSPGVAILGTDVAAAGGASVGASGTDIKQKSDSYQTGNDYLKLDEWNNCNWWTLCISSDYTSIWQQTVGTTTITTNSVKADYPIQIQFMGANTAGLTISSPNAAVNLGSQAVLKNRYGDTSINAKSLTADSGSLIDSRNVTLNASNGSVGAVGAPVNLFMSGALAASAVNGNVVANQIAGSLKVGIVSASGDAALNHGKVVLTTQDDLYGDAGNLISGARIELASATGGIGGISGHAAAHGALNVAPGYTSDLSQQAAYGLKASAAGDIGIDIKASAGNLDGNLLADTIVSAGGDVRLTAPGRILDNNPVQSIDARSWNELLNFWGGLGLTSGAQNTAKIEQAIDAYQFSRTQNYNQYWEIRGAQNAPAVFDAGWHYQASAAERAALKTQPAVTAYEASRTEQYWALAKEIGAYDTKALARGNDAARLKVLNPAWTQTQIETQVRADEAAGTLQAASVNAFISGFSYVASATERADQTEGGSWTTTQLALGINPGALKDVTDTNPVIKAPNVSGRNVTLVAGTGLGTTLPASDANAVFIPNNTDGNISDAAKIALATAEYSDFVFINNGVRINQRLPVNFSAPDGLSASVRENGVASAALTAHVTDSDIGNAYLASLGAGRIADISVDGELRLKVKGPISAVDASQAAVRAGDLILEAAGATIGGDVHALTPFWVQVDRDQNTTGDSFGSLTARAAGAVNLVETGDLAVGGIFSRDAVSLRSDTGSIVNARPSANNGLTVLGGTVQLDAPLGSVGDNTAALAVGTNPGTQLTGLIQAQAGQSIFLRGPVVGPIRSNFNIGPVAAGADALNAGADISLIADNDGSINGNVVAPGGFTLVAGGLFTLSGARDIVVGNPNSVAGTHTVVAPAAAVHLAAGNVNLTADRLTVFDGATLRTDAGTVTVNTVGDAIITGIRSDNTTASAVAVTSSAGRIIDGGDTNIDVVANQGNAVMTLTAQQGVGGVTLMADGSIDTTTRNPLEVDVASASASSVTGGLDLTTQGFLNLTSATAPGDIHLFGGMGVFANTVITTGGGITVTAPTGPLTINQAVASQAINLVASAGSIDTQTVTSGAGVFMQAAGNTHAGQIMASGDINLSGGMGVFANNVITTGGGITVTAPTGPLTINQAVAPQAIKLVASAGSIDTQTVTSGAGVVMRAAGNIHAGQTIAPVVEMDALQTLTAGAVYVSSFVSLTADAIAGNITNQSPQGLGAFVSGPGGTLASDVMLGLVDPNKISFSGFFANFGHLDVSGPGALEITGGFLGTRLTVNNPLTRLVVDTRNNGLEDTDIKLYAIGHNPGFWLQGRDLVTGNFVLQRGAQFMTDGPGGRDVTITDVAQNEVTKVLFGLIPALPDPETTDLKDLLSYLGTPVRLDLGDLMAPWPDVPAGEERAP
jgi:hypothetical protein